MGSNVPKQYRVFSVEQADRITLVATNQFPPSFKPIILSCISAPKVAHMNHSQELVPDEPFAHEAREFVRKKIIGKRVSFIHDDHIEALNRESGRLLLDDDEDIGVSLTCNGMCTVVHAKGLSKYQELLSEAQAQAKKQEIGIFSPHAPQHARLILTHPPADCSVLFYQYKEKPTRVLVERVLSGSSILCMIPEINQLIVVHFTGIFVTPMKDAPPSSVAHRAKLHTELNLLHRTVTIVLEDVLQQKQFLGSVVSGKNIFSEDLLAQGFAKISNSLNKTSFGEKLIAAEKRAQRLSLGIWDDASIAGIASDEDGESASKSDSKKEFEAQVIQIISGDTVALLRDCQTTKVTIANVRSNRTYSKKTPADGMETEVVYDFYTWEAREFLRKLVIGKIVCVKIDYVRSNPDVESDVRVYATIKLKEDGQNVGAMLVGMGLASARVSLKNNADNVDLLRTCEQKAKKAKIGFHNLSKRVSDHKVVELFKLCEKRSRYFLGLLQKGSTDGPTRHASFIDTVLSPTHFKIYVEKINAFANFKISGIITHHETQSKDAELTTDEAYTYALQNIQGHDVDIEIQNMDKYGNFVGNVFLHDENYAVILVRKGLAKISKIFKNQYEDLLREAENLYIESKKISEGRSSFLHESPGHEESLLHSSSVCLNYSDEFFPVMLTEIESTHLFYVCTLDSKTSEKRRQVDQRLEEYMDNKSFYDPVEEYEVVLAQFSEDNRWYRGVVTSVQSNGYMIRFIDYGNAEKRTSVDIRAMTDDVLLRETPPLAREGRLAFVQHIPEQFAREAEFLFCEYCSVPSLYARTEYIIDGVQYFSIFSKPDAESASEFLLREGFAMIDQELFELHSASLRKKLQDLSSIEHAAKADGNGIWQYRSPSAMSF